MPLTTAAWTIIFLGASALLWRRLRVLGGTLVGAGYLLALLAGLLDWRAMIALALLLAAAYAIARQRPRTMRVAGHAAFVVMALMLGFHFMPGFHNVRVIAPTTLTPDAVPFTMYLNLDKPLAGFWLLLVWSGLCLSRGAWSWLRAVLIGLITAVICLGLGLVLREVAFAPKWPDFAWIWMLNNLLLVSLTEEALFRGYLQEALSRRFVERHHGEALAISVAAALFGVAHAAGGLVYVLIAGIAGVGYGIAYYRGGLRAAVMAHFALNLVHFTLFTYPFLAN